MARLVELDASVLVELDQNLRNVKGDDEVKSCLRLHWAKLVPKLYPATRAPLRPDYVPKRIERYLLEPLNAYIADRQTPGEVQLFFDSLKVDEKSALCNKFFKTGEPTFCCRDCATDATCVMCMECFRNSSHTNHRYKMNMSVGGGMCDCGDAEAFIAGHACSVHDVGEQREKSSHEVLANVPADFVRRARLVVEECLQYCIDLLANKGGGDSADGGDSDDEDVTGGMPIDLMLRDSSSPRSAGGGNSSDADSALTHVTVLFNDEIHTYDQVISALSRTLIDCSAQQATDFASKVDRDGRAAIAFGTKSECDRYKLNIERNSRRPFPLRVVVLRTDAYAHQIFALQLISWLIAKTSETEKIKAVLCRVGLTQAARHSSSMVAVFLNNDRNMWKGARMAYHQLLLQCYLQFSDTKLEFTNIYGQLYPALTRRFVMDEGHAHSDSCTSMSVQIFTVPSLARFLISHKAMHNTLGALEEVIYQAFVQSDTGLLMFYKVSDKDKALMKRWFYVLNDVKYLLNTVPAAEHWSPELVDGFTLASDTLLSIFGMLEGMDGNVRQTSSHLEYEPDWEMGFNLAFRANAIFYSFVQWCVSNKAVIEHVIQAAFLQLSSILTRSVSTHTPPPPPAPTFASHINPNGELMIVAQPQPSMPLRQQSSSRDQIKTRSFQLQDVGVVGFGMPQQQQSYKVIKFDVASENTSVHCALSRLTASLVAHFVSLLEQQQQQQNFLDQKSILYGIFEGVVQKFQRTDRLNQYRAELPSRELPNVSRQSLNERHAYMLELVCDVPSLCRVLIEMPLRALVLNAQVTSGMWRRNGFSLVHQLYFYQSNRAREFMIDKDHLALQIAGAVMQPNEFLACLLHKFDLLEWAGASSTTGQQPSSSSLAGTAMSGIQPTQQSHAVDALQTSLFSAEQALAGFLTVLNTAGDQLGVVGPDAAQQLQSLTAATSDVMRHSNSTRNASQTSIVAEEFLQTLLTVVSERYSTLLGNGLSRRDIIEYELIHQLCVQPMSHSEIMKNLPADDDEDDGMELRTEVSNDETIDDDDDEEAAASSSSRGRSKRKAHQEPRDAIVDALLQKIATFRQPQNGAKGLFLLKPEFLSRYNMFCCHYNRHDMSKAETHMAEQLKSQQPRVVDEANVEGGQSVGKLPVFVPPSASVTYKPAFSQLVRLFDCDLMLLLLKSVFESAITSSSGAATASSISNEMRASSDGQSLRAAFLVTYALYEERRQLMERQSGSENDDCEVEFCRKARKTGLLATMTTLSQSTNVPNVIGYIKYALSLFEKVENLRANPAQAAAADVAQHMTPLEDEKINASAAEEESAAAAAEKQRAARLRRERIMSHMKQMQSNFATKHSNELRVIEQQQNSTAPASSLDDADMTDVNAAEAAVQPVCCGRNRTWQHTTTLRSTIAEKFTCILCAEEQRIDMSGTSTSETRTGGDALVYVSFVERSSVLSHAHQRGTEQMNATTAKKGEWQADGIFFRQTQAERTFLLDNKKNISSTDVHEYCVDRRAGMSPHISTCGHVMHLHCWSQYFDSSIARDTRRHPRLAIASNSSSAETFDVLKNEYRCPLCSRLSNAIMPLLHPQTVYLLRNGEAFNRARQQTAEAADVKFDGWLRMQLDNMSSFAAAVPSTSKHRLSVAAGPAAVERQRRRLATHSGGSMARVGGFGEVEVEQQLGEAAAEWGEDGFLTLAPSGSRSAPNMLTNSAMSEQPNVHMPMDTTGNETTDDNASSSTPIAAPTVDKLDVYADFLYRGEGVAPPPRLGADYQRALSLIRTQTWQVFCDRGQLFTTSSLTSLASSSMMNNNSMDQFKTMIRAIAYSIQSMEVALRFDRKALFGDYSFRQHEALRGLVACFSWLRYADKTAEFGRATHEKLYRVYADEIFRPLLKLQPQARASAGGMASTNADEDMRFDGSAAAENSGMKPDEFYAEFAKLMERDLLVLLIGMLTMSTAALGNSSVSSSSAAVDAVRAKPARRVSHDSSPSSSSSQRQQLGQPINSITQLGRSILGTIRHSLQPAHQQQSSQDSAESSPLSWQQQKSAVYGLLGPSGSINDHQLLKLCYGLHIVQVMLSMPISEMMKTGAVDVTEQPMDSSGLDMFKLFLGLKIAQGEMVQATADELVANESSQRARAYAFVCRLREALLPFLRCAALVFHFATLINPPAALTAKPPLPPQPNGNRDEAFLNTQFSGLCSYLDLPLTLRDFQSESEMMDLFVKKLTASQHKPHVASFFGAKRFLFRYPMLLPEFTPLPRDYSEVMCMSSTFTCRREDADENLSPTLCLFCGKLLCSSLYCCTYHLKTGESVGACNYHSLVCGAGTGIFLRIRESMLTMMYGIRKHCLYAAPYVDRYGECDPFLRRGNPLTLSADRLGHILKQYVHHNIADEVVQLFEQQNGGQLGLQQL